MIVLDTNVVSEIIRSEPDQQVLGWAKSTPADVLCVTAVTLAELWTGALLMPEGRRRNEIAERTGVLLDGLGGPVLAFDAAAAAQYAQLAASQRAQGRVPGSFDTQIAAICRVHGAALATRNVSDFESLGVSLVNPWLH